MPNQYTDRPPRPAILVIGPSIAYIPLTRGLFSVVDVDDLPLLQYNYYAKSLSRNSTKFYAHRNTSDKLSTFLHRDILGLVPGDGLIVDHKVPPDTLDNRRANLRVVTHHQNAINRGVQKNSPTGYVGVSKVGDKWRARVYIGRKVTQLGFFDCPVKASEAVERVRQQRREEFGLASR